MSETFQGRKLEDLKIIATFQLHAKRSHKTLQIFPENTVNVT